MAQKPCDFKSAFIGFPTKSDMAFEMNNILKHSSDFKCIPTGYRDKKWNWSEPKNREVILTKIDRVYKYSYTAEMWDSTQLVKRQRFKSLYVRMSHEGETLFAFIDALPKYSDTAILEPASCYIVHDPKVFVLAFLGRTLQEGDKRMEDLLKEDGYQVTDEEFKFYLDYQWNWRCASDAPSLQFLCKLALSEGEVSVAHCLEELAPSLADELYSFNQIRTLIKEHECITKDREPYLSSILYDNSPNFCLADDLEEDNEEFEQLCQLMEDGAIEINFDNLNFKKS